MTQDDAAPQPMTPGEAVRAVLAAEEPGAELHWTVVLDRALREGLIAPTPQARNEIVRALADATASGEIIKTSVGTYRCA